MSLIGWMLRSTLGSQPTAVALFMGDREVTGSGYGRAKVRAWRVSESTAKTTVHFGPYDGPISYDRYVIFAGEERLEEFMEESVVSMPRGFQWDWNPELVIGE